MTDYEDEGEVQIEIEPEDSDFVEEEGKAAICMISGCYETKRTLRPRKGIRFSAQDVW